MKFYKYHNCGNDFIITESKVSNPKMMLDRNIGVGGDNILKIRSNGNEVNMKILNVTDIEGDMCGNGSLCVLKYLNDSFGIDSVKLKTKSGYYTGSKVGREYCIKIGNYDVLSECVIKGFVAKLVNIGEPHAVVLCDDVDKVDISVFEKYALKNKINITLVSVVNSAIIKTRTLERSSYSETKSCGTGACAGAVVSKMFLGTNDIVQVKTKGGLLKVLIKGSQAMLIGNPVKVFSGDYHEYN